MSAKTQAAYQEACRRIYECRGQGKGGKILDLSNLGLAQVPAQIGELTAVAVLYLSGNKLTSLPPEIGQFTALTRLDLSDNQLTNLSSEIAQFMELKELYLHGNPDLGLPVEKLGPTLLGVIGHNKRPAKPSEILKYYFRIHSPKQKGEARSLLEARIIVIGDGAAGKTSLVRQLLRGETAREHEAGTRDVVVEYWPLKLKGKQVRVNVWDFGGQKQMHAAHPYFFTTRTLFLVVAEARKEQQDRVDYWLKMVAKYGLKARALVVINKVEPDGHSMKLDRPKLLGRYEKNLPEELRRAFFPTSCTHGTGIAELRAAIQRELEDMEQIWALWPQEWFKVKQAINRMRSPEGNLQRWLSRLLNLLPTHRLAQPSGAETLHYDEWRTICSECGVYDETDREELLEMLSHLGLVVCFPHDTRLRSLGVLNPEWVTRGIYPLLVDTRVAAAGGIFRLEDLKNYLPRDRYPVEKHPWLVDLMTAFELIFRDGRGRLLMPAQLPADSPPWAQPDQWSDMDTLHLELRYDMVLPESVISQFIVRRHAEARRPGEWWRDGIALKRGQCEALVRAHATEQEAKIELRLRGPGAERRELLASIRETLRDPRDTTQPVLHVVLGKDCAPTYTDLLIHAEQHREMPFIIDGKSVIRKLAQILDLIAPPAQQVTAREIVSVNIHNKNQPMNVSNTIHAHDIINSAVTQTMMNSQGMIQQQATGELRVLLNQLEQEVGLLLQKLPPEKEKKALGIAKKLKELVEQATSNEPEREWFDVSANGLLEASTWVNNFAGNIAGTIGNLIKLLWKQ